MLLGVPARETGRYHGSRRCQFAWRWPCAGTTRALRRLDRPRETPRRDPGLRGSSGSMADVRSADTGYRAFAGRLREAAGESGSRPAPKLVGRRGECEALDRLVADARPAEPGHGAARRGRRGQERAAGLPLRAGAGWRVVRAAGVESEMELAYAACTSSARRCSSHLGALPAPQRDALARVFGRSPRRARPVPGRTGDADAVRRGRRTAAAGLHRRRRAVARPGLGADPRVRRPPPARRADRARVRRADRARRPRPRRAPRADVRGLGDSDARALLLDNVPGPLDARVCDQIVRRATATRSRCSSCRAPGTRRSGRRLRPARQPAGRRQDRAELRPAPPAAPCRDAAARPHRGGGALGDPVLLHRAAGTLGIDMAAAEPALDAGLLEIGGRVEFAHPLVRSAAYARPPRTTGTASTGPSPRPPTAGTDPDRRAWHRARATPGPDEEVAAELERSAGRAQARGGVAAAAAFLQRAVELTVDPARRAGRALAAAQASSRPARSRRRSGWGDGRGGPLDELQRARADLLRGHVAFASSHGSEAAAAAAASGQPARAARPRARPRDLPRRLGRRGARRATSREAAASARSAAPPGRCRRRRPHPRPPTCCSTASPG